MTNSHLEGHLVSCIVVTHNDGLFLNESIPSILNQTHQNIECLIVDDGSTDCTAKVVERWCDDPRFSYFRQEQGGVANARNTGIRRSAGEYIAFLDADDRWDLDKVRSQLQFLLDNPQYEFCWCDQQLMNSYGQSLGKMLSLTPEHSIATEILTCGWYVPPSCWLVKRELFERTGGFDEQFEQGEDDVEMMFRLGNQASGTRAPAAYLWRRIRSNSISKNTTSKRSNAVSVYRKMLSYDNGKYKHMRKQAMFAVHRFLAGHCWENHAYWAATAEAIQAACWNPRFIFDRSFINSVFLGHLVRLIKRTNPESANAA
jgi:glycosyltransferase involved in cell wall biosynthesis